jgi:hypothetical protein
MADLLEARVHVRAAVPEVASLFWDVVAWTNVWNRIEQVSVLYDDPLHQEFRMEVERDGRTEAVRTIRFRDSLPGALAGGGGGDITFFSPNPPPTMTHHRGQWLFVPVGGGCGIVARRDYALRRGEEEAAAAYAERRRSYRHSFHRRLGLILDSFVDHFAAMGADTLRTPATPTVPPRSWHLRKEMA